MLHQGKATHSAELEVSVVPNQRSLLSPSTPASSGSGAASSGAPPARSAASCSAPSCGASPWAGASCSESLAGCCESGSDSQSSLSVTELLGSGAGCGVAAVSDASEDNSEGDPAEFYLLARTCAKTRHSRKRKTINVATSTEPTAVRYNRMRSSPRTEAQATEREES